MKIEWEITCAHCGYDHLHIQSASSLYESGEDNRKSVSVYYWCEGCIGITTLVASNHKGMPTFEVEPFKGNI